MLLIEAVSKFLTRLKFPGSMPGDVISDLGLPIPKCVSFAQFSILLKKYQGSSLHLSKYMHRYDAEKLFRHPCKKEVFTSSTLYSYYFLEGWVLCSLYFDQQSELRRVSLYLPSAKGLKQCSLDLKLSEVAVLYSA